MPTSLASFSLDSFFHGHRGAMALMHGHSTLLAKLTTLWVELGLEGKINLMQMVSWADEHHLPVAAAARLWSAPQLLHQAATHGLSEQKQAQFKLFLSDYDTYIAQPRLIDDQLARCDDPGTLLNWLKSTLASWDEAAQSLSSLWAQALLARMGRLERRLRDLQAEQPDNQQRIQAVQAASPLVQQAERGLRRMESPRVQQAQFQADYDRLADTDGNYGLLTERGWARVSNEEDPARKAALVQMGFAAFQARLNEAWGMAPEAWRKLATVPQLQPTASALTSDGSFLEILQRNGSLNDEAQIIDLSIQVAALELSRVAESISRQSGSVAPQLKVLQDQTRQFLMLTSERRMQTEGTQDQVVLIEAWNRLSKLYDTITTALDLHTQRAQAQQRQRRLDAIGVSADRGIQITAQVKYQQLQQTHAQAGILTEKGLQHLIQMKPTTLAEQVAQLAYDTFLQKLNELWKETQKDRQAQQVTLSNFAAYLEQTPELVRLLNAHLQPPLDHAGLQWLHIRAQILDVVAEVEQYVARDAIAQRSADGLNTLKQKVLTLLGLIDRCSHPTDTERYLAELKLQTSEALINLSAWRFETRLYPREPD